MTDALGAAWTARMKPAEALALEMIATRLPEEQQFYARLQALVWSLTEEMFSARTVVPGKTRTSDLVWWWRQRVNDLGLGTWFQPSIEVQRRGATDEQLGEDPIIQRGDVLHCDVGITALGLNTDTQHMAYVLLPGEKAPPAGMLAALKNANRMQDFAMEEIRPGVTGNEALKAVLTRMRAAGIDGTMYSHPIGKHGHGAGPLVGLWDYQEGVPGRGDATVIPNMWYSIELQATTPVKEWGGQPVRMAQEEDMVIGPDGKAVWAIRRQDRLWLIK
jgi:Xaa-Pro aminopeptidase